MLVRQSYAFWHYTGYYPADTKDLTFALVPPYGVMFLQVNLHAFETRLAGSTGINTLQQASATCSLQCDYAYQPQLDHGHRCTVNLCTDKLLVATEDKGPCMHVRKH